MLKKNLLKELLEYTTAGQNGHDFTLSLHLRSYRRPRALPATGVSAGVERRRIHLARRRISYSIMVRGESARGDGRERYRHDDVVGNVAERRLFAR